MSQDGVTSGLNTIQHWITMQTFGEQSLDGVVCRRSLLNSLGRPFQREVDAYLIHALGRVHNASPDGLAQVAAGLALDVCHAGSAGISLLDEANPERGFRWTAMTGLVFDFPAGHSPRHDSACGDCIDTYQPLLFRDPAQRFTWMQALPVVVRELLVAPVFRRHGKPIGTVWAVHHAPLDHFDSTDMQYLSTIAEQLKGRL